MTLEEIHKERDKLNELLTKLNEKMTIVRVKQTFLQKRCKHPNIKRGHDYDGGSSSYCSDCGYSD